MILSKDEAICLVLELSRKNEVSSPTKLNKLLARLNLHLIPIDIEFRLNKFGSFNADVTSLEESEFFTIQEYEAYGKTVKKFILKPKGRDLAETAKKKVNKILADSEFESLKREIGNLSTLPASEISNEEHKKLLVDVETKFKLEQRLNENLCNMLDLYDKIDTIPENSSTEIKLKALIEYCYQLAKYLKEVRFRDIPEEYDYDAYMFDYYFIYIIHEMTSFLQEQMIAEKKNAIKINKYYQYMINSVKKTYPFSIENKDLKEILA